MKTALIVGAGIGGMAAAIALKQQGWQPIIIERAKSRRTGGYFIGLQPAGREAAEKLGVMAGITTRTPKRSANWDILPDGSRLRVAGFADQLTRPAVLLRGDAEEGLWQGIQTHGIEIWFDCSPVALENRGQQVWAKLNREGQELEAEFDLVIGADGLRSTVRRLAFGAHEEFMQPLGMMICAYQLQNGINGFAEQDGVMICQKKRSLWVFPLEDHSPTALFTYRTDDINAQFVEPADKTLLRVYQDMEQDGIINEALSDLRQSSDYLFDSVNMVKMPKWHNGRIVLLGDAAWCLTLYSGMGATAAMKGGYELGKALAAQSDIPAALTTWEKIMRPFVHKHQLLVPLKSQLFVPANGLTSLLRRIVLRLLGIKMRKNKEKAIALKQKA
ncbi:MAG: FAD-dependent monooxygenase [Neisseria sp.]|uniref:FAD-dependent monooxygenase n=1 Tax=Neisseria sp. TaxID=192066 RepID=UPI0026DC0BB1|nr:FAD-dependent monooxygenase [Neisseria sp.]MDO4640270.1 FAD-dependent monooxygenase [Neisseria sp.]